MISQYIWGIGLIFLGLMGLTALIKTGGFIFDLDSKKIKKKWIVNLGWYIFSVLFLSVIYFSYKFGFNKYNVMLIFGTPLIYYCIFIKPIEDKLKVTK